MKRLFTACALLLALTALSGCGTKRTTKDTADAPSQTEAPQQNHSFVICQSCGMPMRKPAEFGTEADGSQNREYCTHCYQKGAFTRECTMEEMIEYCAQFSDKFGPGMTRENAIKSMKVFFPHLKRWKK